MANTANLGLPLIDDNMVADVSRDVNALASGIDAKAGAVNGLATLGADGKVPAAQLSVQAPADASTTQKGVVKLNDAVNSTSTTEAATPNAVKKAYDEALAGKQLGVEQKANVVAALNSIGISAATSETWAQLVPKIAAVIRATGNAMAADVLVGKTASNASGPFTGSMINRGSGGIVTPGTTSQTKAAGYYSSEITIVGDSDLIPSNIRAGVNIFGVVGGLVEGKRSASGSGITTSATLGFTRSSGVIDNRFYLQITGLGFVPSVIIIYRDNTFVYFYKGMRLLGVNNADIIAGTVSSSTGGAPDDYIFLLDGAVAKVNSTGFTLPALYGNGTVNWIAIE